MRMADTPNNVNDTNAPSNTITGCFVIVALIMNTSMYFELFVLPSCFLTGRALARSWIKDQRFADTNESKSHLILTCCNRMNEKDNIAKSNSRSKKRPSPDVSEI